MKEMERETYFTPREAASYFNLSLSTVKNYIYDGKLKTLKTPGGHHRIRKSELLATLGDRITSKKEKNNFSLAGSLCNAILALFRTLNGAGDSLIAHATNVSSLSRDIAIAMGMSESESRIIELAALVHDIGHLGIDKQIILREGKLSLLEYEAIKKHPGLGKKMLSSIKELKCLADIVAQHHEQIDGTGYPEGLKGDRIEKASRIISIAEAYDAMVSKYSYKRPVAKEKAISELREKSGSQFDKDIVEVLVKII